MRHKATDDALAAERAASTEAERLDHRGYIGCEHLLLGLLSHDTTTAARVLAEHGVSLDAARREVVRIYGDVSQPAAPAHAGRTYTPRANVVGVLAQIEAERLGASKADGGHYLLALLTEGDSAAVAVLKNLGVDLRALRSDLLTALQVPRAIGERYSRERDAYLASP